jgi:putative phosphoribosyl transferase
LLADRLVGAIDWAQAHPQTSPLPAGLFGASTGAAAALIAAAKRPEIVQAVVSRGELNKQALARLEGRKELQIVPGATHLFEEPGALDQVSQLAKAWFERYLH